MNDLVNKIKAIRTKRNETIINGLLEQLRVEKLTAVKYIESGSMLLVKRSIKRIEEIQDRFVDILTSSKGY